MSREQDRQKSLPSWSFHLSREIIKKFGHIKLMKKNKAGQGGGE
jgi:hypothetical protein